MALVLSHADLVKGARCIHGGEDLGFAELGQVMVGVADGERVRDGEAVEPPEVHAPPDGVCGAIANLLLNWYQWEGPGQLSWLGA